MPGWDVTRWLPIAAARWPSKAAGGASAPAPPAPSISASKIKPHSPRRQQRQYYRLCYERQQQQSITSSWSGLPPRVWTWLILHSWFWSVEISVSHFFKVYIEETSTLWYSRFTLASDLGFMGPCTAPCSCWTYQRIWFPSFLSLNTILVIPLRSLKQPSIRFSTSFFFPSAFPFGKHFFSKFRIEG